MLTDFFVTIAYTDVSSVVQEGMKLDPPRFSHKGAHWNCSMLSLTVDVSRLRRLLLKRNL